MAKYLDEHYVSAKNTLQKSQTEIDNYLNNAVNHLYKRFPGVDIEVYERVQYKIRTFKEYFDGLYGRALDHLSNMEDYEAGRELVISYDGAGLYLEDINNPNTEVGLENSKLNRMKNDDPQTFRGARANVSNNKLNQLNDAQKVVIKQGDSPQELAGKYGYDPSDWNKIFVDANGNPLTVKTFSDLKPGDAIYLVGASSVGIFEPVKDAAVSSPNSDLSSLRDPNPVDFLNKNTSNAILLDTYGDYSDLSPCLGSDGSKWEVSANIGFYSKGGIHWGTDFREVNGNSLGKPVTSPANAVVIDRGTGYNYGMGNYVTTLSIVDGKAVVFTYQHLQNGSIDNLRVGQVLDEGQQFAKVGSTGYTTGPHLHIESYVYNLSDSQKDLISSLEPNENGNLSASDVSKLVNSGLARMDSTRRTGGTFINALGKSESIMLRNSNGTRYINPNFISLHHAPVLALKKMIVGG